MYRPKSERQTALRGTAFVRGSAPVKAPLGVMGFRSVVALEGCAVLTGLG
jgi:hypothetical protein